MHTIVIHVLYTLPHNSPLPLPEEGGTPENVTAGIEEGEPPIPASEGPLVWSMGIAAGEIDACVPAGRVDWLGRARCCTASANWLCWRWSVTMHWRTEANVGYGGGTAGTGSAVAEIPASSLCKLISGKNGARENTVDTDN